MAYNTNQDILLDKTSSAVSQTFAPNGLVMITGTAAQAVTIGTYFAIQFVTDCTPTVFTAHNSTIVTSVVHKAGTVIYANILRFTAGASETYILYKK
tara:strand:- start:3118 stop:3408 length:291 start_codon:yes stop_codon:yes gene_type:complete